MNRQERMETSSYHAEPETIEQMQESKEEIENRLAKIFKLIKDNDQDTKGKMAEDSKRRSELVGLIEGFRKQYKSLYERYDHLKDMHMQACGMEEKESSSSTSSSDLDYYSSEEIDSIRDNTKSTFEIDEQKREPAVSVEVHEVRGNQESAQMEELKGKVLWLTAELEDLHSLKNDLGEQIEKKTYEAKELGDKNNQLQGRIVELEFSLKDKGEELSTVLKKQQDNESTFQSRIGELTAQLTNMQQELKAVRLQKINLEATKGKEAAQIKGLRDRIKGVQQKMNSLRSRNTELELQLELKTKEESEILAQIQTLKEEIERKTMLEQESPRMREGYLMHGEELEQRVHSLCNEKNKLEELVRSQNQEMDQLREENDRLHARVFELEDILTDGGDELYTFQKKSEGKDSASSQIMALKTNVNNLEQELDSLRSENKDLNMCMERVKQDSVKRQSQLENEIGDLTSELAYQKKFLKEREDAITKFTEDRKLIKHHSLDSPTYQLFDSPSLNHQHLKRKIEELAGKFDMKMENHIRLLYQRILVSEQMHVETKDGYRKMKERVEQESRAINEKVVLCEAELRQIRDLLVKPGMDVMTGMNSAAMKPDDNDDVNLLNRISRILSELQLAKNWIAGTSTETKKLKHHVDSLTTKLDGKEEKIMLLKKKVWKLEAKLSKEGGDKLNVVGQLERKAAELAQQIKEKNDNLVSLGEEKREAIRQLCLLIDYHRSRHDDLKETMSKMTFRIKRPA